MLLLLFSSQALKQNASVYAHVFFCRSGYPPDPNDPDYLPLATFSRTHGPPPPSTWLIIYLSSYTLQSTNVNHHYYLFIYSHPSIYLRCVVLVSALVTYLPKSKADKKVSLLGDSTSADHSQASSSHSHSHFSSFFVCILTNTHTSDFSSMNDFRLLRMLLIPHMLMMLLLWSGYHIGSQISLSIWLTILQRIFSSPHSITTSYLLDDLFFAVIVSFKLFSLFIT